MESGKRKGRQRILSGLLAVFLLASDVSFRLPAGASDIWPQKDTAPFYCMDGGKAWRTSDRYEEVGRREAGIPDQQARRLFWAYPDIWNGLLKPAAARYDPELYEKIRDTVSDPNVVKRVKDNANTVFAWVADNPEIEERAKAAAVKYAAEKAEAGRTPPAALFNQETGTYAVYENAAVRISVGDFGPGSAAGTDFETDPYFISQIRSVEPQTVYDNGSGGGTAGWIDASQDRNIATSVLGTKLYEISWSGSSLHIINNGSRYANETVLDPDVPDEVKYNKTIVRFRITMKEGSGYVLDAAWNEDYLDEWMRFKVCVDAPDRQRLYLAHAPIEPSSMPFYIEVSQNGTPALPQPGGDQVNIPFRIFRHQETFEADYHVRMKKMDAETGMPVEGSQFYLYERFDSPEALSDSQKDGGLAEDRMNFTPWEGFQIFGDAVTDAEGEISHGDHREYRYEKTYCIGHPAPAWTEIPEEETSDETGETENEDEIEAALDANRSAAAEWLHLADSCRQEMEQGDTHFHWLAEESMYEEMEAVLESGQPGPSGAGDVSAETAFEKSGCREDCEKTYENFINLEFSYTWKEIQAAGGYILHGVHPEDVPIEIITTNSSQAGAAGRFGNGYSTDITENVWYGGGGGGAGRMEKEGKERSMGLYEGEPVPSEGIAPDLPNEKETLPESLPEYRLDLFSFLLDSGIPGRPGSGPGKSQTATGSNGERKPAATGSDAEREPAATESNAEKAHGDEKAADRQNLVFRLPLSRTWSASGVERGWEDGAEGSGSFENFLEAAEEDGIRHLDTGDGSRYSHCSGRDSCGDSWRIYDHRTEGRIHINKRDLELYRKEDGNYSSYGDSQGDGTLEGAVYGLFAAEDILHPDTRIGEDGSLTNTGVVYRKHDLAAVAATDRDGNADFPVYTEAPGSFYDYEKGRICRTGGNGPENLYGAGGFREEIDGYSGDSLGGLKYQNNEELNGNRWIGRPLILGKYYVKELSRSEGYELSVNGILGKDTNFGTGFDTPDSVASSGGGTVVSAIPELSASMEGPDGSGNGYDRLTLSVTSSGTAGNSGEDGGYDLIFSGFPEDTRFYRTDSGQEEVTGPRVTGLEDVIVKDENGRTVWKRAESDESDLKYEPVFDASGNLLGQKAAVRSEEQILELERTALAERRLPESVEFSREGLEDRLSSGEITDETSSMFLGMKARLEEVLRHYGYDTPKTADGRYSTDGSPAFSRGMRKGEIDIYGQTGPAGEPAAATVYGEGLAVLAVENLPDQAEAADLVAAMLSWYGKNPWWSFGGLDRIEAAGEGYRIWLYAGSRSVYGRQFFTMKDAGGEPEVDGIYVAYEDPESLRYVYRKYEAEGEFSFELKRSYSFGSGDGRRYYVDASVCPVLQDDGFGVLKKVLHPVMIFHKKGEEIIDYEDGDPENGYRVPLTERKEKIEITTALETVQKDVELEAEYDPDTGTHRVRVETRGTDSFGKGFSDEDGSLKLSFMAVTGQKTVRLSEEDIASLGTANSAGHRAGDEIGFVRYLMAFGGAFVGTDRSSGEKAGTGEDTYIAVRRLSYRGQHRISEDGDTGKNPVQVLERPVRQKIKVIKKIAREEDGTYPFHTGQVHEDAFTSEFGGGNGKPAAAAMANFRFRLYLKSNLERLYKNPEGEICWEDRNGNPVDPEEFRENFPELVQKLYTRTGNGYERLLETWEVPGEDGEDPRIQYNYEKFFDAVETAEKDKWRNTGEIQNTSSRPPARSRLTGEKNQINTSGEAEENARRSDAVRQFAIDWYLEEEAGALLAQDENGERQAKDGPVRYGDQLYDRALNQAIRKAEEYLKPFFSWNLSRICAVPWDTSPEGGTDGDKTTLAADFLMEENGEPVYSYGISGMLPYGEYVLVEQQPWNPLWQDFPNRHYAIDRPREISLPAVCGTGYGEEEEPEAAETSFYRYRASDTPEQLAAGYLIRFNEEMAENHQDDPRGYVIRAHNADGDFEVYKLGLAPSQTEGHYEPYGNPAAAEYYHYASASETGGTEDGVRTMTGAGTARDGEFAPMLIPWTMTEPENREEDGAVDPGKDGPFTGYAYRPAENRFYSVKLRIEKLDGETGEPILHDNAVFALYAAERNDAPDGDGSVLRYQVPTMITGTRSFLEAMGAEHITPLAREWDSGDGPGNTCYGIVPAGTPACREKEVIFLTDSSGLRAGKTEVLSTERDKAMKKEDGSGMEAGFQTTGYAETPQPVGAGVYVLAELKAPDGYARSRPVAVELYSDQISYDSGDGAGMRAAAVFSGDGDPSARIFVENMAVRLRAEKEKNPDTVQRMRISGRVEGSLSELAGRYGAENLEFAFNSAGAYLGYGWFKGTLEYLEQRKAAGEAVEIVYGSQQVFSGYGYLSGEPDTAEDRNRYVPGAVMALYRALEIRETGDSEDHAFEGVFVERDRNGNVKSITVREGYAGEDHGLVRENGVWIWKAMPAGDTPVLFYDLAGLQVTETGKDGARYGYDRNGKRIRIRSDTESVYALKDGIPVFEIRGERIGEVNYDRKKGAFLSVPEGVEIRHLDQDGRPDAMVDGYTGLAYVKKGGKKFVWPVTVSENQDGTAVFREKILTGRPAEANADTEQAYITGSFRNGRFEKELEPVFEIHGLPDYYRISTWKYTKGQPVSDRDGQYVRYRYDDLLEQYNQASYRKNQREELEEIGDPEREEDDRPLWHRLGEACLIPNVWTTGEKEPNAPEDSGMTWGQADLLKRVRPGAYILEELSAPAGYLRAFPEAVTVKETGDIQEISVINEKTRIEIAKTDDTDRYRTTVINMDDPQEDPERAVSGKGDYTHGPAAGAVLALYRAERVASSDPDAHPEGWYMKKTEDTPAVWYTEDPEDNWPVPVTARWTSGSSPAYFEGIPAGDYILEELSAPAGLVRTSMGITVEQTGELQTFILKNDHTKLEILKFRRDGQGEKVPFSGEKPAELTLYPAVLDQEGKPVSEDGIPAADVSRIIDRWETGTVSRYMTEYEIPETGWAGRFRALFAGRKVSGFSHEYERYFREYGTGFDGFSWMEVQNGALLERSAQRLSSTGTEKEETVTQLWRMDDGNRVQITVCRTDLSGEPVFEYRFGYKKGENGIVSYDSADGCRRLERIPPGYYVLMETGTPEGYRTAEPRLIQVCETGTVWRYEMENRENEIWISKTDEKGQALAGAELALYRAGENGEFLKEDRYEKDRWISGAEGRFTADDIAMGRAPEGMEAGDMKPRRLTALPAGIYYLAELKAPYGFIPMEPMKLEVRADSCFLVRAPNRPAPGRILLKKEDTKTGIPLEGAVFAAENLDTGEEIRLVTGPDGTAESGLLPVGRYADGAIKPFRYRVSEVKPPDGYRLSGETWEFSFDGNPEGEEFRYRIRAGNERTELVVYKTDYRTGQPVAGARLAVWEAKRLHGQYGKEEPEITSWISDGGPHTVYGLTAGKVYILEETRVPDGYEKAEPVLFAVSGDGRKILWLSDGFQTIRYEPPAGADGTGALAVLGRGAGRTEMRLLEGEEEICSWYGSGNGKRFLPGGLEDGSLYTVKETAVYSDGSRQPVRARIFRAGFSGGEVLVSDRSLLSVTLTLKDSRGQILDSWEPDGGENVHRIPEEDGDGQSLFRIGEPYTLEEESRFLADGKEETVVTGRYRFVLNEDGTVTSIELENRPTQAEILKTEAGTGKPVPGARLVLTDPAGTAAYRWVSADTPFVLTGKLRAGQPYVLKEEVPPAGYGRAEEMAFVMPEDTAQVQVEMTDRPTRAEIRKTDLTSGEELPGAELVLKDAAGTIVDQWISKETPHVISGTLLAGETYTLEETGPPSGYAYGESVTFTMPEDGTVKKVEMKDRPTRTEILKTDGETGEALKGAILELCGEDGGSVSRWISGKDPHILTGMLDAGKTYRISELCPPAGYAGMEPVEFTVSLHGETDQIILENRKTEAEIEKTDAGTGMPLAGARLRLTDSKGTTAAEWVTGTVPHVLKGVLVSGETYVLTELQSPAGYRTAAPIRFRMPDTEERVRIVMEDVKIPEDKENGEEQDREPEEGPGKQPEAKKQPGTITAGYFYEKMPRAVIEFREPAGLRIPATGDDSRTGIFIWMLILGTAGLVWLIGRRKKGGV